MGANPDAMASDVGSRNALAGAITNGATGADATIGDDAGAFFVEFGASFAGGVVGNGDFLVAFAIIAGFSPADAIFFGFANSVDFGDTEAATIEVTLIVASLVPFPVPAALASVGAATGTTAGALDEATITIVAAATLIAVTMFYAAEAAEGEETAMITALFSPSNVVFTDFFVSFPSMALVAFEVFTGFVPTTIIFANGRNGRATMSFALFNPSEVIFAGFFVNRPLTAGYTPFEVIFTFHAPAMILGAFDDRLFTISAAFVLAITDGEGAANFVIFRIFFADTAIGNGDSLVATAEVTGFSPADAIFFGFANFVDFGDTEATTIEAALIVASLVPFPVQTALAPIGTATSTTAGTLDEATIAIVATAALIAITVFDAAEAAEGEEAAMIAALFHPSDVILTHFFVGFPSVALIAGEVFTGFVPTTIVFANCRYSGRSVIFALLFPDGDIAAVFFEVDFASLLAFRVANFAPSSGSPFKAKMETRLRKGGS